MRKPLLLFSALVLLIVLIAGSLIFLLERHPFRPGHVLYPLQARAEALSLTLTAGATRKADRALDLAARRLDDVAAAPDRQALGCRRCLRGCPGPRGRGCGCRPGSGSEPAACPGNGPACRYCRDCRRARSCPAGR